MKALADVYDDMKGGHALDAAIRGSLLTMVLILSFDSASGGAVLSGRNCLSSKQILLVC